MNKQFKNILKKKMSDLPSLIISEINKVRQNPSSYIPLIKKQKDLIKGEILYRTNETPIQLTEGIKSFENAIEYLKKKKKVLKLEENKNLNLAALDLVNDIGPKGLFSHEDSNGNNLNDRIEKYCEWENCCNEIIQFSTNKPEEIIIDIIVDDGIENKLNRESLFNDNYKFIGCGINEHKDFGFVIAIILVGGIREKDTLFFDYDNYKYQFNQNENFDKEKIALNDYQINDSDAPDNTVSVKIVKKQKEFNGKKIVVVKKFYKLDDGSEHVVEIEEF